MPSFNKIRSVVPEIRLLGQMSPGHILVGQMLIGQMLIWKMSPGLIVNRQLLPCQLVKYLNDFYNLECQVLSRTNQRFPRLWLPGQMSPDKWPVTNVTRTNVTCEIVYIHEEFTMIGSRRFCDASKVFIASLDKARLLISLFLFFFLFSVVHFSLRRSARIKKLI